MARSKVTTNAKKVLGALGRIAANAEERAMTGLDKLGKYIIREAILRTPVDTGNLRDSFRPEVYKDGTTGNLVLRIVNTASYAIFVHENLEASHEVGQAKFLENAVKENLEEIIRRVAEAMSKK